MICVSVRRRALLKALAVPNQLFIIQERPDGGQRHSLKELDRPGLPEVTSSICFGDPPGVGLQQLTLNIFHRRLSSVDPASGREFFSCHQSRIGCEVGFLRRIHDDGEVSDFGVKFAEAVVVVVHEKRITRSIRCCKGVDLMASEWYKSNMTCIVGRTDGKIVTIAGDSAGISSDYSLTQRADRKVFTVGDFAFGGTSSFRMLQVLQYSFKAPKIPERGDLFKYMATSFVNSIRNTFARLGVSANVNGVESGGTFLVGIRGRLFRVESDYQVGESIHAFDAVGCGGDIALGALMSLPPTLSDREACLAALRASETFSAGVRGPFHVVCSGG